MRFGNIGNLCQSCGRMKSNHTIIEAKQCLKYREIEKKDKKSIFYQRLEIAIEVIRKDKRISRLNLAREIDKKIQTTPWTVDKMKKEILQEAHDIRWDGKLSVYYVDTILDNYIGKQDRFEKSFSLYKNNEDLI